MAGKGNTYVDLAALRATRRLEEDVEIEGIGTFRVQALLQEELRLIAKAARDPEAEPNPVTGGKQDGNLYRQLEVAYGLVKPDLGAADDIDAALETLREIAIPVMGIAKLSVKIGELTYAEGPQKAFLRSVPDNGFPPAPEATPSGSSA